MSSFDDNKRTIKEERIEIAGEGELQSSEMSKENSKIVTTKRILVCDYCGKQIDNIFSVCRKCGKKLCELHSIDFRNQFVCPQDLRNVYPLSRTAFKILLLTANGISNDGLIHRLSGINKKEIKSINAFLWNAGYIERSIFGGIKISDTGREAISAYCQLFGRENASDMNQLDDAIKRYVIQKP